ncbi:MAG: hypothetical protein WA667_05610 [Candidatus Nitrosopolaris sp.]
MPINKIDLIVTTMAVLMLGKKIEQALEDWVCLDFYKKDQEMKENRFKININL